MWFIKDHLGEESGPYEFDDLITVLTSSPYNENATLVRSGRDAGWKPALIVFPDLSAKPETHVESAVPPPVDNEPFLTLREESKLITTPIWSSCSTQDITNELNRIRVVLAIATLAIFLFSVTLITTPKPMTLTSNEVILSLDDTSLLCIIFFLPALIILLKLGSYRTQETAESIQYSLTLYRRLFSALCVAAVLSMGLNLFVTLIT